MIFFYYDWKFMTIFFGAYIKTNYFCKIRQLNIYLWF